MCSSGRGLRGAPGPTDNGAPGEWPSSPCPHVAVPLCVCVLVSSSSMRVKAALKTPSHLTPLQRPLLQMQSITPMSWGLGLQHMNLGDTTQPITIVLVDETG